MKYTFKQLKTFILPMQSEQEVEFMWNLLKELKPKKILEIGTGCGAFTTMLSLSGAKVVTVDNRANDPTGWQLLINDKKIKSNEIDITFHHADSQLESTRDLVKDKYDLVVIDAEHELKLGAKKDWDLYSPMADVVAIHDICGYNIDWRFNPDWFPHVFWKEAKKLYKTSEISDVPAGGWGVIFK